MLFQRLKQPVVLGYLLAGMIVGPLYPDPDSRPNRNTVHALAELGVILLMFSLGIEFSLSKLLRVGATAGFVAIVQVQPDAVAWLCGRPGIRLVATGKFVCRRHRRHLQHHDHRQSV